MTSLKPWLLPTLTGPFLGWWGIVSVLLLLSGQAEILGQRLDTWSFALLIASALASGLVVLLLVADVVLLKIRARMIPTGGDAWLSSILSPVVLWGLWMIPAPISSMFGLALWLLITFTGAAFLSRIVFGTPLNER